MVTSETLEAFGLELRAARVAAGWTLAQLAEEAFDNPDRKGFVSQIENGRKQITPLTVGKLAEALNLPDAVVRPMLSNEGLAEDPITDQDRIAEQFLSATQRDGETGVAEGLMIALAYEYADGSATDLDSAYRGLRKALETARDMAARAELPDNTDAGILAVRKEVQRLNALDETDAADEAITQALAQKKAEAVSLLDLGIEQARLKNDPHLAAERALEKLHLEAPSDPFNALRDLQDEWYVQGRDAGLAFDALVAIDLAQTSVDLATTPNQRGTALNDLGIALQTLGERDSDTKRLNEAVTAYRGALKEVIRDKVPLNWAMTQNNLGAVLDTLGERDSDTKQLNEAVAAYREALEERTREKTPLDWATTQNNLGNTLAILGERDSDTKRLNEAVNAYRDALKERTREKVPLDWAMTQNNLGTALKTLGERDGDTKRLEEAANAYRNALKERNRKRVPPFWANTQYNLADLERALFDLNNDAAHLAKALEHATAAREVYVEAGASYFIERIDHIIGQVKSRQS